MQSISVILIAVLLFSVPTNDAFGQTLKSGALRGQSIKWSTGSVKIVKSTAGHEIRLGADFKTKKGPSVWIYLGNEKPERRISKLTRVTGAQTHFIPKSIRPEDYATLFIYCVPFQAVFAFARLR